jgi:hypothetical protein
MIRIDLRCRFLNLEIEKTDKKIDNVELIPNENQKIFIRRLLI